MNKSYDIANIVFVKNNGCFGIRSFSGKTPAEMQALVISRLGYTPTWCHVEILGEKNLSLA